MAEKEDVPTYELLSEIVASLKYRPKWLIELSDVDRGGQQGLRLDIYSRGFDSYHVERGENYGVRHSFIVPGASYNRESWLRWLLNRFIDVETHEACEFFVVDGKRPFAPNHGPGHDPYMIRHLNTTEAAETTFRGVRREGTQ